MQFLSFFQFKRYDIKQFFLVHFFLFSVKELGSYKARQNRDNYVGLKNDASIAEPLN